MPTTNPLSRLLVGVAVSVDHQIVTNHPLRQEIGLASASFNTGQIKGGEHKKMMGALSCETRMGIAFGLLVAALGALLCGFWSTMAASVMQKEMSLTPGSKTFAHWEKTPVPMYIDIYFYNWTNPRAINFHKPAFTQMGPYRFYEKRTKVNLTWNENGTVSYMQTRHWFFDPDNSNGTLDDPVTTLDLVALATAHRSRFFADEYQTRMSWALTIFGKEVELKSTVGELLFSGYSDKILSVLNKMPLLPKEFKVDDKFGWFYKRNGSVVRDGVFNMDTGNKDLSQVASIRTWNYKNTTGAFEGKCGMIKGSSGEAFAPGLKPGDRVGLFSPDLCRTINLNYEKEVTMHGINAYRYVSGTDFIDSGHLNPETACYCNGECAPLGLHNITACSKGVPIFISYPHFYLGDPKLVNHIQGMNPDPAKHQFHMTIEPNLGVPIDVKGRFQINAMLERHQNFLLYRRIPQRYYIPLLWFDQRATLTEELASEVRLMSILLQSGPFVGLGIFLTGLIISLGFIFIAYQRFQPPKEKSPIP